MNRSIKTVLIILIAVFGAGILFVNYSQAQSSDNLVVQFETTPLFNEVNFLPGQNIARWVKATNNSAQTQRIAAEAINESDPNRLGDVLNLEIKEGETTRYNDALSKFFTAGEVFLSDLAGNETQTQYDFIVSFYSGTQNSFQGKSLNFDILVGFQGTEGGLLPGAGGGAGGFLPAGLTILNESVKVTEVGETSITITWLTSYLATSQIIYAKDGEKHTLDLTDNTGTPPKYGYERTTAESDTSPKVTYHSVVITDLTPGTKYYYRVVSHASLAIGREYDFTTFSYQKSAPPTEKPPLVQPETPEIPEASVTSVTIESNKPLEQLIQLIAQGQTQSAVPPKVAIESQNPQPAPVDSTPSSKTQAGPPPQPAIFFNDLLAGLNNILSFGTDKLWLSIAMGALLLLVLGFAITYFIKKTQ